MKRQSFVLHIVVLAGLMFTNQRGFNQSLSSLPGNSHAVITDIPREISYQGLITNDSGKIIADGNYQMTTRFYSDVDGSAMVWEGKYSVAVHDGVFNLRLGSDPFPFPASVKLGIPLWIGVQVNNQQEMRPLTAITSSLYALNVADSSVTTQKLSNGAVTSEKISANYVSGIIVNGRLVTKSGLPLSIESGLGVNLDFDDLRNTLVINSSPNLSHGSGSGDGILTGTPFSAIIGDTNTSSPMYVGSGASLSPTGTGVIEANHFIGAGSVSNAVDLATSEVNGMLNIVNGGTNSTTALSGSSIMISNGTSIVQGSPGTASTVLHGNATGAPTFSTVGLSSDVSGILGVAHGGTGSDVPIYWRINGNSTAQGAITGNWIGTINEVTPVLNFSIKVNSSKVFSFVIPDASSIVPNIIGGLAGC